MGYGLLQSEDNRPLSEVWEYGELQAFGDKLGPSMEAAGMQLSGEPEVFDVHVFEMF
jgi:hypothetical protein